MIGFLKGRLAMKQPPTLILDVNGVGYELEAPMSTFYGLPSTASPWRCLLTWWCARTPISSLDSAPTASGAFSADC